MNMVESTPPSVPSGFGRLPRVSRQTAGEAAIVRVLAPICADKFRQASDSAAKLTALKGTDSWKRDDFIKDTGYATFPGSEYDRKVADACVELLTQVEG